MTNEAIVDHDKNLLWKHHEAVKNLAQEKTKIARISQLAEDFCKWVSTCGDDRINVKAEHRKLDETVRSMGQTYKDIFAMALECVDAIARYEKEVNELTKRKAAAGLL